MTSNTLPGNSTNYRELATPLQHDQAPRLNRIQATSSRGVRACIRRVAGCATPTGSVGHAGATANLKLTFQLDHSAGADHTVAVAQENRNRSVAGQRVTIIGYGEVQFAVPV